MTKPVSFVGITYNDNTKKPNGEPESASFQFPITDLTSANVVAQSALVSTLEAAIDAVVIGVHAKTETVFKRQVNSVARAVSTAAQRENKWLFRYHGATTHSKFRYSVPTADLSLLPDGSEFLDLTVDPGLALKTAFDAVVKSPDDSSEATSLDSVQFVGRNT